jgi:hypothetical protein
VGPARAAHGREKIDEKLSDYHLLIMPEDADPTAAIGTGAFVTSGVDLVFPGGLQPLVLQRSYSSTDTRRGPLGRGAWPASGCPSDASEGIEFET